MIKVQILLPLASALLMVGCHPSPDPSQSKQATAALAKPRSSVAVINMQRIIALMQLDQQVSEKRQKLAAEFGALQQSLREAMEKKLTEYGDDLTKLTEAQRKELDEMEISGRNQLRTKNAEAQQVMGETQKWMQRVLDQKTKGPIKAIADKRGFDLVLYKRPGSFAFSRAAVDITDEVIALAGIGAASDNGQKNSPVAPEQKSGNAPGDTAPSPVPASPVSASPVSESTE